MTTSKPPARFYRWANRIPFGLLKSQLDFLLREIDPLLGIDRMAAEVVEIIDEATATRTVVLRPSRYWQGFEPGQFVTLEVTINGVRCRRNYSISSSRSMFERDGLVCITVKRVKGGRVSNHLHDHLVTGSMLHLSEAHGAFALEQGARGSQTVFLAAGSGITPIMAMIEALAEQDSLSGATLIYAVDCEDDLIFADRLSALADGAPEFRFIPHYSSMDGFLNEAHLKTHCPDLITRTVYLCGPEGFMMAVRKATSNLGLDENAILSESFGAPSRQAIAARMAEAREPDAGQSLVMLEGSGQQLVASNNQTLLELAEQAGLSPKYGCRSGICHECSCEKSSGQVINVMTGRLVPQEQRHIQACISVPVGDVSIVNW